MQPAKRVLPIIARTSAVGAVGVIAYLLGRLISEHNTGSLIIIIVALAVTLCR